MDAMLLGKPLEVINEEQFVGSLKEYLADGWKDDFIDKVKVFHSTNKKKQMSKALVQIKNELLGVGGTLRVEIEGYYLGSGDNFTSVEVNGKKRPDLTKPRGTKAIFVGEDKQLFVVGIWGSEKLEMFRKYKIDATQDPKWGYTSKKITPQAIALKQEVLHQYLSFLTTEQARQLDGSDLNTTPFLYKPYALKLRLTERVIRARDAKIVYDKEPLTTTKEGKEIVYDGLEFGMIGLHECGEPFWLTFRPRALGDLYWDDVLDADDMAAVKSHNNTEDQKNLLIGRLSNMCVIAVGVLQGVKKNPNAYSGNEEINRFFDVCNISYIPESMFNTEEAKKVPNAAQPQANPATTKTIRAELNELFAIMNPIDEPKIVEALKASYKDDDIFNELDKMSKESILIKQGSTWHKM